MHAQAQLRGKSSSTPSKASRLTELAILGIVACSSSCQLAKKHPEETLKALEALAKTTGSVSDASGALPKPGAKSAHQGDLPQVDAVQYDPVTRTRFVDLGEKNFYVPMGVQKKLKRQMAEAEDLLGGQRLEARLQYLQLLNSKQVQRQQWRENIAGIEKGISDAQSEGNDGAVEVFQRQLEEENAHLESSRRVPIKDLDASMDYGYGQFLLDLAALSNAELGRLVDQLDERAEFYRQQASMARAKISSQEQHQGRGEKKLQKNLARMRTEEEFFNEMASAFSELVKLIEANDLEGAQALADRKWAETDEV